jgi:murein DD-endopeptidase MepM/ murein hydrolase activator NlpD
MADLRHPQRRRSRQHLASVRRRACLAAMLGVLLLAGLPGCGGRKPGGPGVIHHVEAGENLYRIGLRYGVTAKDVARANGIRDVTNLRVGQRLYIPGARRRIRGSAYGSARAPSSTSGGSANLDEARRRARKSARQQTSLQFSWPVRGRLSSQFGMRKGRSHEGIDIAAKRGTPIFCAESGRVIHSGRLGSYGKVVIVKHAGRFRTVYAHASKLLVRKGEFVERGQKIAEVGSTGRSTGPHVHFEIRRSESPQNPLGFLP